MELLHAAGEAVTNSFEFISKCRDSFRGYGDVVGTFVKPCHNFFSKFIGVIPAAILVALFIVPLLVCINIFTWAIFACSAAVIAMSSVFISIWCGVGDFIYGLFRRMLMK